MPAWVKLALIFAVLLSTHLCGFLLRYRFGRHTASEITFFLACLFYGAAIWLVAQIFNINAGDADGFWWWSVGVLPFALYFDTLLLHALLVVLLSFFAGFSVFGSTVQGGGLPRFLGLPPSGAYSVLLLALPGLLWAYRRNSSRTIALYAPLLAWWVILQPFAWRLNASPVYLVGCVGGLLLLAAECHPEGSPMAIPFRFYGALLTTGALIPLSYFSFQRDLQQTGTTAGILVEMVIVSSLAVVVSVAFGEFSRRAAGRPVSLVDAVVGEDHRRLLPIGIILFMMILSFWTLLVGSALAPTVLANAAMIILSLWLMQVGLRDNRGVPFSSGVLLFLLWAVLRYIDLFGDFGGMLGASLMFFLCGATLFLVAEYWRRRKVVHHV